MPIFAYLVYLTLCHWYSGLVWYSVECPDGPLDYILTKNRKVSITLGKTRNVHCCLCHGSMNLFWSFSWIDWTRTPSAGQWPLSHSGGSSSRDIVSNTTTALWCCSLVRFLIVHCHWPWSTDFLQRPDWWVSALSQNHHFCTHYVFEFSSNPWNTAFFFFFFLLITLHWTGGGWWELLLGLSYFNTFQPTGQRTNLTVLPPTKNVHSSFFFRNQENDFPMGPL